MTSRLHLYSKIHKAQRAWLTRALVAAGRVDPQEPEAVAVVSADARRLADHLNEHGRHEDQFIHPLLYEAAPELGARLDAEHAALEADLEQLGRAAEAREAGALYLALAEFVVRYFPHLEVEERVAMPALWERFDDGAFLERILRPFITSRSSDEMIADLNLQIGALNPQEERQLLSALLR